MLENQSLIFLQTFACLANAVSACVWYLCLVCGVTFPFGVLSLNSQPLSYWMYVLCFLDSLQIERFLIPLFTKKSISKSALLTPNESDSCLSHTSTKPQPFY